MVLARIEVGGADALQQPRLQRLGPQRGELTTPVPKYSATEFGLVLLDDLVQLGGGDLVQRLFDVDVQGGAAAPVALLRAVEPSLAVVQVAAHGPFDAHEALRHGMRPVAPHAGDVIVLGLDDEPAGGLAIAAIGAMGFGGHGRFDSGAGVAAAGAR